MQIQLLDRDTWTTVVELNAARAKYLEGFLTY